MQEISITLETVTPLFLGGAEPRQQPPELRPAAFRGAMRYWLRALLGGKNGDLEKVKEIERLVFGGTSDKDGASGISLSIPKQNIALKTYQREKRDRDKPPAGLDYLYWSMDKTKQDGEPVPARQYIAPGSTFQLDIRVRPGVKNPDQIMGYGLASLWLLIHLGGLGARSRRTAGSLTITSELKWNEVDYGILPPVTNYLTDSLNKIRAFAQAGGEPSFPEGFSEFDVLHPSACDVWALGSWHSYDEAVTQIGERYYRFRSKRPDGVAFDNWLSVRSEFGLPIKGLTIIKNGRPDKEYERRSSPVWMKISPIKTPGANSLYVGIATLFKSRLLPAGLNLRDKEKGIDSSTPADFELVRTWIEKEFPKKVEVAL